MGLGFFFLFVWIKLTAVFRKFSGGNHVGRTQSMTAIRNLFGKGRILFTVRCVLLRCKFVPWVANLSGRLLGVSREEYWNIASGEEIINTGTCLETLNHLQNVQVNWQQLSVFQYPAKRPVRGTMLHHRKKAIKDSISANLMTNDNAFILTLTTYQMTQDASAPPPPPFLSLVHHIPWWSKRTRPWTIFPGNDGTSWPQQRSKDGGKKSKCWWEKFLNLFFATLQLLCYRTCFLTLLVLLLRGTLLIPIGSRCWQWDSDGSFFLIAPIMGDQRMLYGPKVGHKKSWRSRLNSLCPIFFSSGWCESCSLYSAMLPLIR